MQRREFIGLVGSAAAAWPLASRAQQTPMPVIGLLTNGSFERSRDNIAAFHQGLARTGYIEGRNLAIGYGGSLATQLRLRSVLASQENENRSTIPIKRTKPLDCL
jgi:putative ABC transport system substrate-binding protein